MSDLTAAPCVPLDKIEWRIDSEPYERNGKTTARYVPYVDAVTVAGLLDEWVGPFGWRDEYETGIVAGKEAMWARLSIFCDGDWITKTDVGVPSNMEAQKGAVSDAFKRVACLKWGIARNVYEMPTVYAHCRTFTSQGKTKAAADGQRTLDDIAAKLKDLGYSETGGRVRDHEAETVAEEASQVPEGWTDADEHVATYERLKAETAAIVDEVLRNDVIAWLKDQQVTKMSLTRALADTWESKLPMIVEPS